MLCLTLITGNRPNLVMTDVPEIVYVVVGSSLGTSDHFFVSCVFRVEQSVPEYNVRSTVFLKHRPTGTVSALQSGALDGAPFFSQLIH